MEITEVRVKLADTKAGKLKAFATVTFDNSFVVREIKVIGGTKGLFVAMPSRRLNTRCRRCRAKNHLRARYCNDCGLKLSHKKQPLDDRGRAKLYADIAHPIKQACRDLLQKAVVEAYREEIERWKRAGYRPAPDGFAEDAGPDEIEEEEQEPLEGDRCHADGPAEFTDIEPDDDASGEAAASAPRGATEAGGPRQTAAHKEPAAPPGRRSDSSPEPRTKPPEERRKEPPGEGAAGDMGIFA